MIRIVHLASRTWEVAKEEWIKTIRDLVNFILVVILIVHSQLQRQLGLLITCGILCHECHFYCPRVASWLIGESIGNLDDRIAFERTHLSSFRVCCDETPVFVPDDAHLERCSHK